MVVRVNGGDALPGEIRRVVVEATGERAVLCKVDDPGRVCPYEVWATGLFDKRLHRAKVSRTLEGAEKTFRRWVRALEARAARGADNDVEVAQ